MKFMFTNVRKSNSLLISRQDIVERRERDTRT
jgi:hypothetical protein